MKNIILLAIATIALSFTSQALEPISVVFPYDGSPEDLSVELVDYGSEEGIDPIYTEDMGEQTPNSSGIIFMIVGENEEGWEEITASDVSAYYVLNVKVGEDIKAQFRLDELINISARTPLRSGGLTSATFDDVEELGNLNANILVFTGETPDDYIDLSAGDLNESLPNNATYMIVNNSSDDSYIDFLFPPEVTVTVQPREFIILLKVGDDIYFQKIGLGFRQE